MKEAAESLYGPLGQDYLREASSAYLTRETAEPESIRQVPDLVSAGQGLVEELWKVCADRQTARSSRTNE